ncbi:MAG TPA: cupin domain-containing protein [Gaiellaceae bacterium]|jgi:quercetin dioxygenase-like cupin family protein|nr:cupin domain-containing protein [Gaiellaceae bacterium]
MSTLAPATETRWFTGTRCRILVGEESHSLVEMQAAHGDMPPLHVHHGHDEIFYVLAGRMSVHLPGRRLELGPGEAAFAPREVPHVYRVDSEEGARWLAATTSGEFAAFVEETSLPADGDGYAPEGVLPAPPELVAAGARHGIEVLGPPGMLPNEGRSSI